MTGWASIFFVCWSLVFFQFESCSVELFNLLTQTRTRFWPVSLLVSLRKQRQPEHPQTHSKNTNSKFISVTLLVPPGGAPGQKHISRDTGTAALSPCYKVTVLLFPQVYPWLFPAARSLMPFTIPLIRLLLFNPFLPTMSNSTASGGTQRKGENRRRRETFPTTASKMTAEME